MVIQSEGEPPNSSFFLSSDFKPHIGASTFKATTEVGASKFPSSESQQGLPEEYSRQAVVNHMIISVDVEKALDKINILS